jgi:2'-5' RNA ligase
MADQHTGIMIALMVPPEVAQNLALGSDVPGATPASDLHITIHYLGDTSQAELQDRSILDTVLSAWASENIPIAVKLSGLGLFNPQPGSDAGRPLVLLCDSDQLDDIEENLEDLLDDLGIDHDESHGFNPHVTLAYLPATASLPAMQVPDQYVVFNEITLAWGDIRTSYKLDGLNDDDYMADWGVMAKETSTADVAIHMAQLAQQGKSAAQVLEAVTRKRKTQKAANFGAKVGQNIAGRLIRGAGGKFASNGAAPDKPAASDAPAKVSKTDQAKAEAKQKIADARKADKESAAQDSAAKFAQNVGDTLDAIGANPDISEILTTGDSAYDISGVNAAGKKAMLDAGLGKDFPDGTFDLTPAGKALVRAAGKGDAKAAKRVLATAQAVADRKKVTAAKRGKKKKEFEVQTSSLGTTFKVYTQADGKLRWVTFSSTAFKDKDGHYVTQKSLADDVERADTSKNYGPLRWWHVDGLDIGTCDYNAMHGPILIESGTFTNEKVAQALASTKKEYGVSIGFKNFIFEPDQAGAFNYIERFERSVLPAEKASNWFTKLFVTSKKESDMKAEKFQGLVDLLDGDADAAMQIVQKAEQTSQQAKEAGATFKEVGATDTTTKDENQVYVAEMSTDELNTHIAGQLQTGLQPVLDAIAGLGTQQTQKENSAVTALTAQVTGLAAQVTALTETVKGLTGESTKAFRASQSGTTIVPDELAQTVKQVAPQPDPMDDFMKELSIIR